MCVLGTEVIYRHKREWSSTLWGPPRLKMRLFEKRSIIFYRAEPIELHIDLRFRYHKNDTSFVVQRFTFALFQRYEDVINLGTTFRGISKRVYIEFLRSALSVRL